MSNSTVKLNLWKINSTVKAHCFSKVPKDRAENAQGIWIPRSMIEHVSWQPVRVNEWQQCIVTMPEWFAEKKGLI